MIYDEMFSLSTMTVITRINRGFYYLLLSTSSLSAIVTNVIRHTFHQQS